jgi:hypothetical protein
VIYEDPPSLAALRPGLEPFEAAVLRALAKRPEDRFQEVSELAAAVLAAAELNLDLSGEHYVPGRITRPPTLPPVARVSSSTTRPPITPSIVGETLLAPTGQVARGGRARLALAGGAVLLLAGGGVLGVRELARRPKVQPVAETSRDARASSPDVAAARDSRALEAHAAADRERAPALGRKPKKVTKPKRPPEKAEAVAAEPAPEVEPKPKPKLEPEPKLEAKPRVEPKAKVEAKPKPKPKAKTKDWIVNPDI